MDPQRFHGPRPWARTQESGTHRATAALIFACAHLNKFSGIKKVIKCPSIKAKINFSLENHPHVWEKTLYFLEVLMILWPNKSHWSEPQAAMNVSSEYAAVLALPVVAQFRR